MTMTATVHPYAGSTPGGLVYGAPVEVQVEVVWGSGGEVVMLAPEAGDRVPLWSVLTWCSREGRKLRSFRAVAIDSDGDRLRIHTEPMVRVEQQLATGHGAPGEEGR